MLYSENIAFDFCDSLIAALDPMMWFMAELYGLCKILLVWEFETEVAGFLLKFC